MKLKQVFPGQLLRSDAMLSFSLNGFGLVLLFLQQIAFARILGENHFGIYSFIQSIFALSAILTNWGMGTLSSREIGANNDLGLKKGFYLFSHLFVLGLNVLMGILLTLSAKQINTFEHLNETVFIFIFASIFFYLKSFVELLAVQYQAEGNTIISKLSGTILPMILSISGLALASVFIKPIQLLDFFILISVAFLVSAILVIGIKKPAFFHLKKVKIAFESKYWIQAGLNLMLLSGLYVILGKMNNFILGLYLEPKYVGYYSVCLSLSALVLFGLNATNQVLAPKIAKSFREQNREEFQKLILQSAKVGVVSTSVFLLFLIFFGKTVLSFFGPEFSSAYPVLLILSFGYLASTFAGPVGLSLTMTGKEKWVIAFTSFAAILNFILSLLWVANYGILGVAVANAIGLVLLNIPLAIFVKRKFQYRTYLTWKEFF